MYYYRKPTAYYQNSEEPSADVSDLPSVSVIIVSRDESKNLAKSLPVILNQNYPNYEVIVVNDGSTDESELLLKTLKKEYSHLYTTFSPTSYDPASRKQKILSLTIGIKAANNEVLLFTEADTIPNTDNWIRSMMNQLSSDKDIVLGYCRYTVSEEFDNQTALFDNLIFSLQYLSKALMNKPYTGVYRNVAYRKRLFFDNKGFSSALNFDNAENVFLNHILKKDNAAVSLSPSSFVTCELDSYYQWKFIKSNYMRAKICFTNFTSKIFSVETYTRYLFYIFTLSTLLYSCFNLLWVYMFVILLLFCSRFLLQYFVLKNASEHFQTKRFCFSIPAMDIIQPYYNSKFYKYSKKTRKRK